MVDVFGTNAVGGYIGSRYYLSVRLGDGWQVLLIGKRDSVLRVYERDYRC